MKTFKLAILVTLFLSYTGTQVVIGQSQSMKTSNDTIWSTSFDWEDLDSDRGWTLPDGWTIVDNTDFGYPWVWMKDSIQIGNVVQRAPSFFDSNEDGCINIPVQGYVRIDGVWQANPADTYIQTPPIDCSASSGVIVSFNQSWRLCCSGFELLMGVTNDDGVHWAFYDMLFGTGANVATPPKYRKIEVNISDVAAGMSDVQIRFWFKNAWDYYWMIDDLALTEASSYDLVLEDSWIRMDGGFDETIGHLNYLPKSQIGIDANDGGMIGDLSFGGALINFGMNDAEDVYINTSIQKNGTEVFSENSETTLLWLLDRDTLNVNETFLPDDYGDYQVSIEAVQPEDERPQNNINVLNFTVNDTLLMRADRSVESSANSGGWGDGYNAGDMVGMIYDIYAPTEINSITAYIAGYIEESNPAIQYILMKYMEEEEDYVEYLGSDIYYVDSTMVRKWITLPMEKDGESEFIEPGSYIAAVKSWGDAEGDEDGIPGTHIGWDLSTKSEVGYTYVYMSTTNHWFNSGRLMSIGMNLNETGGPTIAPVTFNVDMNNHIASGEFNPDTDFVDVVGSFNEWLGSAHMTDEDQDGIYTLTIEGFGIGQSIEFIYRINANWDTAEFASGGPNRSYTIRYWNVLNHVYNGGETVGVDAIGLELRTSVYPNPSSGNFVIKLESEKAETFSISIRDIKGSVFYTKEIKNTYSHTEALDLNLVSGVYFISVQSNSGTQVHKLMVK